MPMSIEEILDLLEELDGNGIVFTDDGLVNAYLESEGYSHDTNIYEKDED